MRLVQDVVEVVCVVGGVVIEYPISLLYISCNISIYLFF